mmetsp:Transcript_15214/g.35946  ORF Transcript_15214/g.35946 Transcript_15214/m.35946 type:complete len:90 (+) Transcript_15214:655-924(+)
MAAGPRVSVTSPTDALMLLVTGGMRAIILTIAGLVPMSGFAPGAYVKLTMRTMVSALPLAITAPRAVSTANILVRTNLTLVELLPTPRS